MYEGACFEHLPLLLIKINFFNLYFKKYEITFHIVVLYELNTI